MWQQYEDAREFDAGEDCEIEYLETTVEIDVDFELLTDATGDEFFDVKTREYVPFEIDITVEYCGDEILNFWFNKWATIYEPEFYTKYIFYQLPN